MPQGVSLYDIPSGGRGPMQPPIFGPNAATMGSRPGGNQVDPMAQMFQSMMMMQMMQKLKEGSGGGGGGGLLGGLLGGKGGGTAGTAGGDPLGTGALTNFSPDILSGGAGASAPIFL